MRLQSPFQAYPLSSFLPAVVMTDEEEALTLNSIYRTSISEGNSIQVYQLLWALSFSLLYIGLLR